MQTTSEAQYAVFVGIDRSDQWLDFTVRSKTGKVLDQRRLKRSGRDWREWLLGLRKRFRRGPIVACFEQPAANLIAFFSQFDFVEIFAINPSTLNNFRKAFVVSRAKDDDTDSDWLAELARVHHDKLTPWRPDEADTRLVQRLVEERRRSIDERTRLNNRFIDHLKGFFPEALELVGETVYSQQAIDFFRKWATLEEVQCATDEEILHFYRSHQCVRRTALERRLRLIRESVPLTSDPAVLIPAKVTTESYLRQFEAVLSSIEVFNTQIDKALAAHQDAFIFQSLPGAGEVIAPRLLAAMGSRRDRWESADGLLKYSGIAPILKRSGNTCIVRRRRACPKFLRQSFHEFASESIRHCHWARAFYQKLKDKGMKHNAAVRTLAYKWIRIIFRLWQERKPYDDAKYMDSLRIRSPELYQATLTTLLPREKKSQSA